jgi:hypothetical protein
VGDDHRIDAFMPEFDARERYATTVRAPAALVYQIARDFDLQSVPLVRLIFRLRGTLMRATPTRREPRGFLDEMQALGWSRLFEKPGEIYIAGGACQPWLPDVVFTPVAPDRFRAFAEPNRVKIAWTLETHARDGAITELATETRAAATDPEARRRFLGYWRWARVGIVAIRWLLLPAIRREAEVQWRRRAR